MTYRRIQVVEKNAVYDLSFNQVKQFFTGFYTDAIVLVFSDGKALVKGTNEHGELGFGNTSPISTFTHHPFLSSLRIRQVSFGKFFCIVWTYDDKLYASGQNSDSQLFTETATDDFLEFKEISKKEFTTEGIDQLVCGSYHTLLLTKQGKLYSCGFNSSGQLGIGDRTNHKAMQLINPAYYDHETIRQVASGSIHSVLLTTNNRLFFTGSTSYNQYPPSQSDRFKEFTDVNYTIERVICEGYSTLLLTDQGEILYCGKNFSASTFKLLQTPNPVRHVVAGLEHSVLICNNGVVLLHNDHIFNTTQLNPKGYLQNWERIKIPEANISAVTHLAANLSSFFLLYGDFRTLFSLEFGRKRIFNLADVQFLY
jgi:alpha-tubulin suppressor-like RCC1 family protein